MCTLISQPWSHDLWLGRDTNKQTNNLLTSIFSDTMQEDLTSTVISRIISNKITNGLNRKQRLSRSGSQKSNLFCLETFTVEHLWPRIHSITLQILYSVQSCPPPASLQMMMFSNTWLPVIHLTMLECIWENHARYYRIDRCLKSRQS
jgi:hypothetical protein